MTLIEDHPAGIESVEFGFEVLSQLRHRDVGIEEIERVCNTFLKSDLEESEDVSVAELRSLRSRLNLNFQKIWDRVFLTSVGTVGGELAIRQTYEGRFGAFAGAAMGLQLGVRTKKKQTPLGRRFLYLRPLFPIGSGYGAGFVFGGVSARAGETNVSLAQDSSPGTQVLPGVAFHECAVDAGRRTYRSSTSLAFGLGVWENLSSPLKDGFKISLKPDYSLIMRDLAL